MFIKFVRILLHVEAFSANVNAYALPSVKYADALPDRLEVEGETFGRITYYIPGVGSRLKNPVAGVLAKLHGMTTGKPSDELVTGRLITCYSVTITVRMVIDAYLYIAQHYQPNDRIWSVEIADSTCSLPESHTAAYLVTLVEPLPRVKLQV